MSRLLCFAVLSLVTVSALAESITTIERMINCYPTENACLSINQINQSIQGYEDCSGVLDTCLSSKNCTHIDGHKGPGYICDGGLLLNFGIGWVNLFTCGRTCTTMYTDKSQIAV